MNLGLEHIQINTLHLVVVSGIGLTFGDRRPVGAANNNEKSGKKLPLAGCIALGSSSLFAADTVPVDAQMPGTQPQDTVGDLRSTRCGNCHADYDPATQPGHHWRGSMMAHAGRDPIFWATLAIAEQDFDGAGGICVRCHMPGAWLAGRSTPIDGSALTDAGEECDLCHRLTNPENSGHLGVQNPPFLAQSGDPAEGHYGSGQYVYEDIGVAPVCVSCHNEHKDSPRRDFKLGGFMGGVVILTPLDS